MKPIKMITPFILCCFCTNLFANNAMSSPRLTEANKQAQKFIKEFQTIGIAFSMLSTAKGQGWNDPSSQHFRAAPKNPMDSPKILQAVSITRKDIAIQPYGGDSDYGLAFSIGSQSDFYQYFAMQPYGLSKSQAQSFDSCSPYASATMQPYSPPPNGPQTHWSVTCNKTKALFCGRCVDGGPCAGTGLTNNPNWLVISQSVSHKYFLKTIDKIVSHSGSKNKCSAWANADNIWNEFDTGGFSASALRGVLVNDTPFKPANATNPSDKTLCRFFKQVKQLTTPFHLPLFSLKLTPSTQDPNQYKSSTLKLKNIISCT